jgi:flagellar motor protein MotB
MEGKYKFPGELPMPPEGGESDSPDRPDPRLAVHMTLSRAAELARGGRYDEANLLMGDLRFTPHQAPAVHHLLACIRAQVGLFDEAEKHWKKVLQYDREHEGARKGLRAIQRLRSRSGLFSTLLAWPVALSILAGFTFLMVARSKSPSTSVPADALNLALERLASEQEKLTREVTRLRLANESLEHRLEAKASTQPGPASAPEVDLKDLTGVITKTEGEVLFIRFASRLFEIGAAHLKPEAEKVVLEVGKKLVPLSGKVRVHAVGYPAAEPAGGGEATVLAQRRADHLVEYLRRIPGISPDTVSAGVPSGDGSLPFPKDPPDTQTVILRVAPVIK